MAGPRKLPSIGGGIVVDSDYVVGDQYRYTPYKAIKNVYITKAVTTKKKKADVDKNIVVQLGGPFLKVGDEYETIGGGSQKVGAGN